MTPRTSSTSPDFSSLRGKRICLSHPHNITYDVRLLKSVRALREAGAEVSIMVRRHSVPKNALCEDLRNIEIIEVDTTANLALLKPSESRIWPLKVLWNLFVFEPLRRLRSRKRGENVIIGFAEEMIACGFDIVHFTDYVSAAEAARMAEFSDIPVVYETYEYSPTVIATVHPSRDIAHSLVEQEIAAMDRAAAVIVVGDEICEKYRHKTTNENVHVVLNVPLDMPLPPRPVHNPMRFYFQSIIRPDYGLEMLVDVFSQVTGHWELAIQGPNVYPKYRQELERRVQKHGLYDRISFLEPVTSSEVVAEANRHDVGILLIPSIQEGQVHENAKLALPNKFFTYANAGLAMVLGDYIAMKRIMQGYDAVSWVDELSRDDVVAHIQELIDDPTRVNAMKQASAEWSQHHNLTIGLQQICKTYLSVAEAIDQPEAS
ncbi:MAG: glycosyltransferase family 4 protein [Coriobacteriia bacterium]|nr:glycosyltransferase family 4 protein [Coriobacteriia bacterium]